MKIISGAQTGVDRAALDAGRKLGIPIGGSCPKGRLAEDGTIDLKYPLQETATADYMERTRKNVMDADGTLILYYGALSGGTGATKEIADELHKPCLAIDMSKPIFQKKVLDWIKKSSISILNVAGPRESKHPGIYRMAYDFLMSVFRKLPGGIG